MSGNSVAIMADIPELTNYHEPDNPDPSPAPPGLSVKIDIASTGNDFYEIALTASSENTTISSVTETDEIPLPDINFSMRLSSRISTPNYLHFHKDLLD